MKHFVTEILLEHNVLQAVMTAVGVTLFAFAFVDVDEKGKLK